MGAAQQLYTSASILLSKREAVEHTELAELTGLRTFVTELAGHIAIGAAR